MKLSNSARRRQEVEADHYHNEPEQRQEDERAARKISWASHAQQHAKSGAGRLFSRTVQVG